MIVSMLIVVVGASFDEMYIEDNAEKSPMNKLLIVTISAGVNWGMVNSIVGHLRSMCIRHGRPILLIGLMCQMRNECRLDF